MIKVAVMYPNRPGARFDYDYYVNRHMKMVIEKLTPFGLVKGEVDKGIGGTVSGNPQPYAAIGYMYFNSLEEFEKTSAAQAEFQADIPNYTDINPEIQVSEIIL